MTSTNKIRINRVVNFQGFHFIFEPHPDNEQRFVKNALNDTAQRTLDNPSIIDPLFENSIMREKLVDNALILSWDEYIKSYLNNYPAVNGTHNINSEKS